MEQNETNLKTEFEKALENSRESSVLSPEYRRKKTIIWVIRTLIAITLFIVFWEYNWVRLALIAYIPLNLFSLISIYAGNALLKRKVQKTRAKIEEAEKLSLEEEN